MVIEKTHKTIRLVLAFILLSTLFSLVSIAHEEGESSNAELDRAELMQILHDTLVDWSVKSAIWVGLFVTVITIIAIVFQKELEKRKKILFLAITVPVILVSIFLIGSTITLNVLSETKGPIHWHADYEIYHCGERVDLVDPQGLSNRVGTPVFHEHNDDRVHVEGTVMMRENVNLQSYLRVLEGEITQTSLSIPTNRGILEINNGDACPDGKPGELQVFLYKIVNPDPDRKTGFIYKQEKLENFPEYILAPYFYVPPGDCFVIEFGESKERTDHICTTYEVAIEEGDLRGS